MKWLIVLVFMGGCASTTRLVTKKCPVPVTAVMMDFVLGAGAFAVSSLKKDLWESAAYSGVGTVLIGGAFVSEISCMRGGK